MSYQLGGWFEDLVAKAPQMRVSANCVVRNLDMVNPTELGAQPPEGAGERPGIPIIPIAVSLLVLGVLLGKR